MSNKHLTDKYLTDLPEYKALLAHKDQMDSVQIAAMFADDPLRFDKLSADIDGLVFDYSKQLLNEETVELLLDLARTRNIESERDAMFSGAKINNTEDRAVLHTALRGSVDSALEVEGENVSAWVNDTLEKINNISTFIRGNRVITDVVNIGIGGSDLGPAMICEALARDADGPNVHFVSNVDGAHCAKDH